MSDLTDRPARVLRLEMHCGMGVNAYLLTDFTVTPMSSQEADKIGWWKHDKHPSPLDHLRVQCKMLQDDKAALMADNANLQNHVVMPLRKQVTALTAERDARIEALQDECNANNDEVILLTAERDALQVKYEHAVEQAALNCDEVLKLREQLTLAESVRAAQVAGLTAGAGLLRERVEALERGILEALPSSAYMDPPDGGDVDLVEQLGRMAKDAARYRWLRSHEAIPSPSLWDAGIGFLTPAFERKRGAMDVKELDAAIDAAMKGQA